MSFYVPLFFSSVFLSSLVINVKGHILSGNCYPFRGACKHHDYPSPCPKMDGCICKDESHEWRFSYKEEICLRHFGQTKFGIVDKEGDDSEEDSSEEDDDEDDKKYQDFGTPIIVGIVLGTIIVCGWSFAICTLYLRKMKLRRIRSHRKRLRRRPSRSPSRRPPAEIAAVCAENSTLESHYALLTPERDPTPNIHRHSTGRSLPVSSYPQTHRLSMPSNLPSSPAPIAVPEEEPLPAYDPPSPARYLEPDFEAPPSYEEAMKDCA